MNQVVAIGLGGFVMLLLRFGDVLVKYAARRLGVEEDQRPPPPIISR